MVFFKSMSHVTCSVVKFPCTVTDYSSVVLHCFKTNSHLSNFASCFIVHVYHVPQISVRDSSENC